jgi:hypothetical protein
MKNIEKNLFLINIFNDNLAASMSIRIDKDRNILAHSAIHLLETYENVSFVKYVQSAIQDKSFSFCHENEMFTIVIANKLAQILNVKQ